MFPHLLQLRGQLWKLFGVIGKHGLPRGVRVFSMLAHAIAKALHHAVWHQKLGVLWPAIQLLRLAN